MAFFRSALRSTVDLLENVDASAEARFQRDPTEISSVEKLARTNTPQQISPLSTVSSCPTPTTRTATSSAASTSHVDTNVNKKSFPGYNSSTRAVRVTESEDERKVIAVLRREINAIAEELDLETQKNGQLKDRLENSIARQRDLEAQVKDAYSDLERERERRNELRAQVTQLSPENMDHLTDLLEKQKNQIERLERDKKELQQSYDTRIEALKSDHMRNEHALDVALADVARIRADSTRREEELTQENDELMKALTAAQQALERRDPVREADSNLADDKPDNEAVVAAEATAANLRREIASLKQQLGSVRQQLRTTEYTVETQRKEAATLRSESATKQQELEEANSKVRELKRQLDSNAIQQKSSQGMALRLKDQQEEIDRLSSEIAVLRQQLHREQRMRSQVESDYNRRNGFSDGPVDPEIGATTKPFLRHRTVHRESDSIASFVPASNRRVVKLAQQVDHWFLYTAQILRTNSGTRLMFILYIVLLHIWALFILVFHTHRMSHEAGLPEAVQPSATLP